MSLYRRILQDLRIIETDVERFCGSSTHNLESRIESLRHGLMYIIPYWDSRLGETYSLRQLDDFKDGNEFLDYWLRKVDCSTGSSCEGDECLWHTADYFYSSSYLQEWENDWVKCVEGVLESLESVQHVEKVTLSMSDEFRTIKRELGLLLCFHKSVGNWNIEKWEEFESLTNVDGMSEIQGSRCMKDYAQRGMRIFKLLPLTNVDGVSDISTLAEEISNYLGYWWTIRYSRPLNLTLEDPCGPEYETLGCITDDLRILLIVRLHDLPSQMESDIRRITKEVHDIRFALSPIWTKIFVEIGISYAIARDIYNLADEASHIISDLNTDDGVLHTQQKIAHIRDVARKIYMKYYITPSCIDDFFRCARLILEESVLRNTPAARYLRDLSLLHTFIKDNGNMYHQIQLIFCDAWMQLWSVCLRESESRKEFLTLSLDIFKNIRVKLPHRSDLLVDMIENLVQMPKANELLHELRRSLVTAEDDSIFVKLVYTLEKNLVKTFKTEEVVDAVEDVEVEVTEAAHNYILFFREFKNDDKSSLKEGVKGFNASLRHAYGEYIKVPSMELPMSELEFFDVHVNLTELPTWYKESDIYNPDQIGVLHDDLSICFSFLRPYTMRHDKPEEVNLLWAQFTKLGREVNNMILTFEEFPPWYNKLRAFYLSEEVKLIKEKLSKISSIETSKTEVEGSKISSIEKFPYAENHMENQIVSFEEEDRLREQLTTGSRSLEKISIVGMPGLGKTTLAMSLYKDCAKSFHAHAWCYVGQEFRRKELLQNIIGQISERPSSEINAMKDEDLAKLLKQCLLQKRNYLIVLDDVWDVDAWDALRICFPPSQNGSRILITTRYNIIGEKICGDRNVIKLNLLTPDKSWLYFKKGVILKDYVKLGKELQRNAEGCPFQLL